MDIGAKLKFLRAQHGLRQVDVSVLSGVDHTVISRIENGRINPTPGEIAAIKTALGWDDTVDQIDRIVVDKWSPVGKEAAACRPLIGRQSHIYYKYNIRLYSSQVREGGKSVSYRAQMVPPLPQAH